MKAIRKFFLLTFFSILLTGCFGTNPLVIQDSGPDSPVDVSHINNAVVKKEPLSRYGNPDYYEIAGKRYYVLNSSVGFTQQGMGSWYGRKFHGRRTSSGETYNMYKMTAAHTTLPLPTYVQVTNLENGKTVVVKVNDRGPFHDNRIIDLSYTAATKLGFINKGTARVELVALTPGVPKLGGKEAYLIQIGAFSSNERTKILADDLEKTLGKRIEISAVQKSSKLLYRLRLGPFVERSEAQKWLEKILNKGFPNARLVTATDRWQNL
jgi:rare lipoprotein A